MDPWSAAVDEVALEGLDGITIPSLWIRLEDRRPKFPLKFDDCTKELIWQSLLSNDDLTFYALPEEREDVVLTDRFENTDPDTGIEMTLKTYDKKKDIYPIHAIVEDKNGIQGSCAFFKERKDVTKLVRSKSLTALVSLAEALERYGRKLVVVASQTVRFRALIGIESDPDVKLNDESYCLLERVGRARWQGELQSELHGRAFKMDARKLHYVRKSLVKHGLVSMQPYVKQIKSGNQQHSILLLLKRFYVNRKNRYDRLTEQVSNHLQQLPGQFATMIAIKKDLDLSDKTARRLFQHMRAAKLLEICKIPLEEVEPTAKRFVSKQGNKLFVCCVRLLKPYSKKAITDDEEDDEDDEDETGTTRRAFPTSGRIMEKDILSQAYEIVLSSGTKGIAKTDIAYKLNIGKQESRMLCRRLERDGFIKGFMVDEGRQRTTKYLSHKCVGVSDQLQLFVKEQERNKLLSSSAPLISDSTPATFKTSTSPTPTLGSNKDPGVSKIQNNGGEEEDDAGQTEQICAAGDVDMEDEELDEGKGKTKRKSGARRKSTRKTDTVSAKQKQDNTRETECETPVGTTANTILRHVVTGAAAAAAADQCSGTSGSPGPQREASNHEQKANNIEEVKDILEEMTPSQLKVRPFQERSQETYRLLRRKNLIVEAVHNLKVIEGLFPLQKLINNEEKQHGVSSKCCRKTIMRIIHCLSREGLLKLYRTTVIQDGVTKKMEIVAHPSIQPSDDIVQQLIQQVRFKISSSYNALCLQQDGEKRREQGNQASTSKGQKKTAGSKRNDFKPTPVRGLGKSLGFQPKIHRLRIVHTFLWYLIYGHPLQHSCTDPSTDSTGGTIASQHSTTPDAQQPQQQDKQDLTGDKQTSESQTQTYPADTVLKLEVTSGDEEEEQMDEAAPACSPSAMKVYCDEDSWKRFIPPMRVRKEFSRGCAIVGDLLVCLPLSTFIQVIQINYQVDGLEEYLNDPVKQHYLVRVLPLRMRKQLLYKRKYLFAFYESLQRLVFMGLLQFGPMEKFKEKDQIVLYLKRNATIVDTTSAEPHYWLVAESPDKPFERRKYIFNTAEDVENYWFDLMCVCLNTPLGVIRTKRNASCDDSPPAFVRGRTVIAGMAHLLKGSNEACDDGVTPGDGRGAGGLDSEFFAHLKRNWFWTSHLLAEKDRADTVEAKKSKIRLKSLLSKNALRLAIKAGETTVPRCLTTKLPVLAENIVMGIEPATRNQRVVGGKRQKRKRSKKEVVKAPRKKKKEPKKRSGAHDEVDHKALKMMTRQRVYWSVQEDSLIMLCSVASHLLNCKLKRPFIGHCVVRDLLHSEFETSVDKTSLAVGRRTRYILQNPQALLNYRICLAEVYQDKALVRLLEEKKPTDPNKPEDCAESLLEYTRLLRQKFSSALVTCDLIIPDTTQELFSRYKVSAIESGKQVSIKDDVNSTDDIHSIVLHNLIQSTLAMTNSQMKSSRSFQTFHTYSKYNQELLARVFIQCRKRGLVNRRRVGQAFGPKKNRALPILPMSYQLSQSYYRRFSWRFPHSLCTDSFRFVKSLIDNGTGDDRPVFVFHHETENRSEDGEEMVGRKKGHIGKGDQSRETTDGQPAGEPDVQAQEANTKEEEKNQSHVEGEKPTEVNMKNPDDCMTPGFGEDPSNKEQTNCDLPREQPSLSVASNTEPALSEDPPDVSDMMKFSLDSPGAACMALLSLISLGLMNIYVSIPKQMVLVDSSMVDDDTVKSMATLEEDEDDEDGEECEGRKKMEVKAHQASHTKYLMMRGFCLPGLISVRNLSNNDSIVVESCNIKLQLRNTPAHHIFSMENSPPLDLMKCGPSLLPSILTDFISFPPSSSSVRAEECDRRLIQHRGYTPQDIEACAQLRRSLHEAGKNGLDVNDLLKAHAQLVEAQSGRTRSLQQYMKDLQEEGQVLNVGAECVRYVLLQHAEPWLLTVNTKQWLHLVTPDRLPFQGSQHGIPLLSRRRRHRDPQDTEEPPAKKAATGGQESRDGQETEGRPKDAVREESNEEKQPQEMRPQEMQLQEMQPENPGDGGSGGKELNLNEEVREEDGEKTGQERMETEVKQEGEVELGDGSGDIGKRADEAHSPLTEEPDADKNVSFISRPWRIVDGNLNRLVCKGMLEAVLYHIMSKPGVTQLMLVEHYRDVLQPVALLDLVQALIEMGCVTKKTLVKCPKPSLFTRSVHQARSETTEKVEEPDTVFYEPTISCCVRLGQVLPNERHWKYFTP